MPEPIPLLRYRLNDVGFHLIRQSLSWFLRRWFEEIALIAAFNFHSGSTLSWRIAWAVFISLAFLSPVETVFFFVPVPLELKPTATSLAVAIATLPLVQWLIKFFALTRRLQLSKDQSGSAEAITNHFYIDAIEDTSSWPTGGTETRIAHVSRTAAVAADCSYSLGSIVNETLNENLYGRTLTLSNVRGPYGWESYGNSNDKRAGIASKNGSIPGLSIEIATQTLISFLVKRMKNGQVIYSSPKIRLDRISSNNKDRVDCEISKTSYFNSILTHEIYPHSVVVGGVAENQRDEAFRRAAEEVLICDVRDGIPSARALVDLADSRMSNHFGINTLVFKCQEGFIVQRQSARNLIVPGKLVPTGSGSSDWKSRGGYRKLRGPLKPGADFKHILQCEAYRELAEETRIRFSQDDVSNIEILGMARDLNRGGKPDFFFAYALPENSSDNEAELRRRANRFLNKELLFVDDFTSDLALGYFFKPKERGDRQVKCNEQSEYIPRSIVDEINAKSEKEYVRQILSRISPRAFKQEFVPTGDELLAARHKPEGEIPESYWITMLKLIRWHPEAGQPLQVNAHLLLKRFEKDPDFRRRFFAPQIRNRKPEESAGEHFESDD